MFFVISGYLITRSLLQDGGKPASSFLAGFYARRMRRLLPAAFGTLAFIFAFHAITGGAETANNLQGVLASLFYVENWRLALMSVDYLGAEAAPAMTQHFWSLGIEEQYYLVWPVLILGAYRFSRARSISTNLTIGLLALLVFIFSYSASVSLTKQAQEYAYFATHTRVWELAAGSMLAVVPAIPTGRMLRSVAQLVGIFLILIAAFAFDDQTAFPGYLAIIPVLGCMLLLWFGGESHAGATVRLLSTRPMTFLGDISYSLYLWHWPVLLAWQHFAGEVDGDLLAGFAVILLSLAAGTLSTLLLENPFRRLSVSGLDRARRAVFAGLAASLAFAGVAYTGLSQIGGSVQSARQAGTAGDAIDVPLSGQRGQLEVTENELLPPLELLSKDIAEAYDKKCHLGIKETEPGPCIYGRVDAPTRVLLLGDSHAAQWIPAFRRIVDDRDWYLESHTKSGCPVLLTPVQRKKNEYHQCSDWGRKVVDHAVTAKPDLIVYTLSKTAKLYPEHGHKELVAAIGDVLEALVPSDARIVVIADTPRFGKRPSQCSDIVNDCYTERDKALEGDPLAEIRSQARPYGFVDMTDWICRQEQCHAVEGSMIVWRDRHHLTRTYSERLFRELARQIDRALN